MKPADVAIRLMPMLLHSAIGKIMEQGVFVAKFYDKLNIFFANQNVLLLSKTKYGPQGNIKQKPKRPSKEAHPTWNE